MNDLEVTKDLFQNFYHTIHYPSIKYGKTDFVQFTYIYIIGHCNPSVSIIDLISHTTYVVCVNFIHNWRNQQFKFFKKLFIAILFILEPLFTSNKPTHYLLDQFKTT